MWRYPKMQEGLLLHLRKCYCNGNWKVGNLSYLSLSCLNWKKEVELSKWLDKIFQSFQNCDKTRFGYQTKIILKTCRLFHNLYEKNWVELQSKFYVMKKVSVNNFSQQLWTQFTPIEESIRGTIAQEKLVRAQRPRVRVKRTCMHTRNKTFCQILPFARATRANVYNFIVQI